MKAPLKISFTDMDQSGIPLPSFFSAWLTRTGEEGILLDAYYLDNEAAVVWRFRGGKETTGPPGYCHGGFLASLLDECMGSCGIWEGLYLMAINLEVSYKKAVETGRTMYCVSRILKTESRKISAEGWITDKSQKVYVYSRGTYLSVDTAILKEQPPGLRAFEKYRKLRSEGKTLKEALDNLQSE